MECDSRVILCWYFSITFSSSVHVNCTERKNCGDRWATLESTQCFTETLAELHRRENNRFHSNELYNIWEKDKKPDTCSYKMVSDMKLKHIVGYY